MDGERRGLALRRLGTATPHEWEKDVMEYGIFNDEGLIEGGFRSERAAKIVVTQYHRRGEICVVKVVCPDHEEHANESCEPCMEDE